MAGPGGSDWPVLTAAQMREVDRIMVEELHIELVQMMENAGVRLAELAVSRFHPGSATVLAGSGGNGGGGLVAARHLTNRGVRVSAVLAKTPAAGTATAHQLDILRRLGVPVSHRPREAELVVDAIIGYSLRGDPTGPAATLIAWANRQPAPVLSLDLPSGMDASGNAHTPCVLAAATLALAALKVGLPGASQAGELYLADIGVPPSVYGRLGLPVGTPFASSPVVRVP